MSSKRQRDFLRERAGYRCEYCQMLEEYSHDPFSMEHIIPSAKGGDDTLENLAWSCLGCNNLKAAFTQGYDLVSEQLVPFFHPRTQLWSDHFRWDSEAVNIIGKTPSARATISRLQLNRPGLVKLRRLLAEAGLHPPR